jgi:hypothetical protein
MERTTSIYATAAFLSLAFARPSSCFCIAPAPSRAAFTGLSTSLHGAARPSSRRLALGRMALSWEAGSAPDAILENRAQVYPHEIVVEHKSCVTAYGQLAYRTLRRRRASLDDIRATSAYDLSLKMGAMPTPTDDAGGTFDVVFVHGLGEERKRAHTRRTRESKSQIIVAIELTPFLLPPAGTDGENCQPTPEAIGGYGRRWLIPDLIGHGRSDISSDTCAYKMDSQARAVVQMLVREGTRRCAVVAHSKSACERA